MNTTVRKLDFPRLDPEAALQFAAEQAARITGADGAAIAIGDASAMCCCASAGDAPLVGALVGPDSGLSGICLRTSELVQCDDTANDPRVHLQPGGGMNLRSVLIVPVAVEGRLQAILEVFSLKPHAFNAQHRHELSRIAQGIATLLSEANAKRQSTPLINEHPAISTNADAGVERVQTASPGPATSTVSDLSQGRQPERALIAPSVRTAPGSHHAVALPPRPRSLSATAKAGIGVALVIVLALGWYFVSRTHTPAVTGSAPATKASATPSATPEQRIEADAGVPEITVEQSSLTVSGLEGAPQATRSAPQLTPGRLMLKVDPVYPASARAQGVSGSVVLTALVTKDGRVANVQFVRGPEVLASPAIEAVRQWVYEPYRLGGAPVAVQTMIDIKFTPRRKP
jgi:TonB family protein